MPAGTDPQVLDGDFHPHLVLGQVGFAPLALGAFFPDTALLFFDTLDDAVNCLFFGEMHLIMVHSVRLHYSI